MTSLIQVINCSNILIILDGAMYQHPNEIKAFKNLIERNMQIIYYKNVNIKIYANEKSAIMGSAYYALWDKFNFSNI